VLEALIVGGDLARADGAWRARPLEHARVPRTATEAAGGVNCPRSSAG
jgi:hypothetical protein